MTNLASSNSAPTSRAILNRSLDFWLLGGISIVVWAVMLSAHLLRGNYEVIGNHFLQTAAFFSLASLICNHPHFMLSYRFGYGRGGKFILKNYFALILVPVTLIALYIFAYFNFNETISASPAAPAIDQFLLGHHIYYSLSEMNNVGTEILTLTAGIMFLTVGWHYSKQIFGCMMVYAKFDDYPISPWQRKLIKASVFSIAWFNFFSGAISLRAASSGNAKFLGIPLVTYNFPQWSVTLLGVCVCVFSFLTPILVFYPTYKRTGKKPSLNFLVPWVAFHVWWLPIIPSNEFYLITVPFFHSLQYLPFAYRMETRHMKVDQYFQLKLFLKVILLLAIGFTAFEFGPTLLDRYFDTFANKGVLFFLISFVIFINIHHFFIDSVVWRFNQPEVKKSLFR